MAEQRQSAEWKRTSLQVAMQAAAAGMKGVTPEQFDPYRAKRHERSDKDIVISVADMKAIYVGNRKKKNPKP